MVKEWKLDHFTKSPDEILAAIKGPRYEEYRRRWSEAGQLKVVQDYPIHIDFELHYGCNFQCPQCILQVPKQEFAEAHPYHITKRRTKIDFAHYCKIIDEGVPHGLFSITLNVNNEPLLNKDIDQYIRYACQKGVVDVIMLTNGSLLTKEMSHKILESGITKLYFSLDAIREETYKIVRKGGNFKQTMENIHYFLDLKKQRNQSTPITRVSFCRSKVNAEETQEFIDYWQDRVDFIDIQSFMSPYYEYSNYKQMEELLQVDNNYLKEWGACPQPYRRLTIYNDGSIHPCCNWEGAKLTVGNIFDDSVYNIWNSQTMKDLRAQVNDEDESKTPKACQVCRKTAAAG
jgi:radical SAM protein with 4Fe4S-binding SPASM domain